MAKSVYSLVLADEVVAAIDELAARQGFNRSSLVNHILAEHASLITPEVWNGRVLKALDYNAAQLGLHVFGQSANTLTVRTALSYKYNPSLSYVVEMGAKNEKLGRLRLTLRSQNHQVLAYFVHFFQLWEKLEKSYLSSPPVNSAYVVQDKRYQRIFRRPDQGEEETAKLLAEYIYTLDGSIKAFFRHLDDAPQAVMAAESFYLKMLKTHSGLDSL